MAEEELHHHTHVFVEMEFCVFIKDKIPFYKDFPTLQSAYRQALSKLLQDKKLLQKFILLEVAGEFVGVEDDWYEKLAGVEGDTGKLLASLLDTVTVVYPGDTVADHLPKYAGPNEGEYEGYATDALEKCLDVEQAGNVHITFHTFPEDKENHE
jgi:hypothetical protein